MKTVVERIGEKWAEFAEETDPIENEYKTCCGRLTSIRAARVVAVLDTLVVFYLVISAITIDPGPEDSQGHWFRQLSVLSYSLASVGLASVTISLWYGLHYEKRPFLFLHLLKDLLFFFISVLVAAIFLFGIFAVITGSAAVQSIFPYPDFGLTPVGKAKWALWKAKIYIVVTFVLAILHAVMQIWFFTVVLSAIRCMKAKSERASPRAV